MPFEHLVPFIPEMATSTRKKNIDLGIINAYANQPIFHMFQCDSERMQTALNMQFVEQKKNDKFDFPVIGVIELKK